MSLRIPHLISVLTLLTAANLHAAPIVIGLPAVSESGNCLPFSCAEIYRMEVYQQAYLASAFPGPFLISALEFYHTQLPAEELVDAGTFTLGLGYTTRPVDLLDLTDPANNVSSPIQMFYTGPIPQLSNSILRFTGIPFLYDPAQGNLLLVVTQAGAVDPVGPDDPRLALFLDQADSPTSSNRAFFGGGMFGNDGGLITGFQTPVPEPRSSLLMMSGMVALAGWLTWRRHTRGA